MDIKGNIELIEACLVRENGFLSQVVHNICTGAATEVPYGAIDLLMVWGLALLFLALISITLVIFGKSVN